MKDYLQMTVKRDKWIGLLNALRINTNPDQMITLGFHYDSKTLAISTADENAKVAIWANLSSDFFDNVSGYAEAKDTLVRFCIYMEDVFDVCRSATEKITIEIPEHRNNDMLVFHSEKKIENFRGFQALQPMPDRDTRSNVKDIVFGAKEVLAMKAPLTVKLENGAVSVGSNDLSVPFCTIFHQFKHVSLVLPMEKVREMCDANKEAAFMEIDLGTTSISSISALNAQREPMQNMDCGTILSSGSVKYAGRETYEAYYSAMEMDMMKKALEISQTGTFILNTKKGARQFCCEFEDARGTIMFSFYDEFPKCKN